MKSRNGAETNKTQKVWGFKSNSEPEKNQTSTASTVYGEISINHIRKTKVTTVSCIKILFQLSGRPRRMLKTAEGERERAVRAGATLPPSYSPCLEA